MTVAHHPGIEIHPFLPTFGPDQIDDLRDRLRRTRWSPEANNADSAYGVNGEYLRELMRTWEREFDWDDFHSRLNAFHNYKTTIDGIPVHFVHVKGKGPNPMPIIVTHGWPETYWDLHSVIGPLTDPAAHGGDPADAFDVVVPSLPGFAFSNPLEFSGVNPPHIAPMWHRLMQEGLGYERFAAAGGDWGSFVTSELAMTHPDDLLGIYLTYPPRFHLDVENLSESDYAPEELEWRERQRQHRMRNLTHVQPQTHGPQTLAWGMNDSPVGLASWLLEPRQRWSDCNEDPESVYSRQFLLDTFSLFWMTETIGSSMRIYADTFKPPLKMHATMPPSRITVPTGIGVYPHETSLAPRKACERVADVVLWSVHERGGHFAAAEQPAAWVDDARAMFRPLR